MNGTLARRRISSLPALAGLLTGLRPLPGVKNDAVRTLDHPTLVVEGEYPHKLETADDLDNKHVNEAVSHMLNRAVYAVRNLDHSRFQVQGVSFHFDPDEGDKMTLVFDLFDDQE